MDKNPKRRRYRDNPYSLSKDENKKLYIVSFKDPTGVMRTIEVTEEVYRVFDESELKDLSEMNEFDRHTEHSEIYENNLNKRAKEEFYNLEDDFIMKASFEELKSAIKKLPEIQRQRIKKYYFEDKNEYQIAKEEKAKQQSIHESLERARKNIKEILKNFQ